MGVGDITFVFVHDDFMQGFEETELGVIGFSGGELAIGGRVKEVLVEDEVDIADFFDEDGAKIFVGVKHDKVSAGLEVVEDSFLMRCEVCCT